MAPAEGIEFVTPPGFDSALIIHLRRLAEDGLRDRSRTGRRVARARRRVLVLAAAAGAALATGAAIGGTIVNISLDDPDGGLRLVAEPTSANQPQTVRVEALPSSSIVGTTSFDCAPAEPVSVCGSIAVSTGSRVTEAVRIVLRVSPAVATISVDMKEARLSRGGGFVFVNVPADVVNDRRQSAVRLSVASESGEVLDTRPVRLPLIP